MTRSKLPPQYATFIVPLNINKLDFRDYLYHAYSIKTVSITSRIFAQAVTNTGKPGIDRPGQGLHRPKPVKKMTVLMEEPFVWPEPPDEEALEEEFNVTQFRAGQELQQLTQEQQAKGDRFVDETDREAMRAQAKRLLAGKERWKPPAKEEGNWSVRRGAA